MVPEKVRKFMAVLLAVLVVGVFVSSGLAATEKGEPNKAHKEKGMAERKGGMHERGTNRLEELTKKLNLTEEQQKSIKPILEKQDKDIKAIMDDNSIPREQKREKMRTLHQTTQEEINKILTPEQQKKFAEMGPGGRDSVKERIEMLTKRLDLTEEQQKSITPILEKESADMKAIHENTSLTSEQRIERFKTIQQTTKDAIMKVLTPEQQKKFEEMRLQGREGRDSNRPMHNRGEGKGRGKGGPEQEK